MKYHREADGRVVVSLTKGDDVRSSLEGLAAELGIGCARLSGIGALQDPEIGWWDTEHFVYHKQVFPGVWELLSMDGNISLKDGSPFMHIHVAISGHDYAVKGGHFFESVVGVVLEVFMDPHPTPLPRRMCDEIGLPRWEPGG